MTGTDEETRVQLIARIVKDGITERTDDPQFYNATAETWGLPPATFNRLKNSGRVRHVAYRKAEIGLRLPSGLLLAIREGDYARVVEKVAGLEPDLRHLILTTLNLAPKPRKRATRKSSAGS